MCLESQQETNMNAEIDTVFFAKHFSKQLIGSLRVCKSDCVRRLAGMMVVIDLLCGQPEPH